MGMGVTVEGGDGFEKSLEERVDGGEGDTGTRCEGVEERGCALEEGGGRVFGLEEALEGFCQLGGGRGGRAVSLGKEEGSKGRGSGAADGRSVGLVDKLCQGGCCGACDGGEEGREVGDEGFEGKQRGERGGGGVSRGSSSLLLGGRDGSVDKGGKDGGEGPEGTMGEGLGGDADSSVEEEGGVGGSQDLCGGGVDAGLEGFELCGGVSVWGWGWGGWSGGGKEGRVRTVCSG